jgi:5-methylcytosine-specific restriction enzyme A
VSDRDHHGRIMGRKGVALRRRRLDANPLCADCLPGRVTTATRVDHIKPLALGGLDVDENTRNLCVPCHDKRTREQFGQRQKPSIGADGWPT